MKIRDKLGLVIVFAIALAIIAFLLMDALNSNSSLLRSNSNSAGTVNGTEISIRDFESKVQEAIENYKASTQKTSIDDRTLWQLREQTWTQYVNDVLFQNEYDELGIEVTPDELFELVQGSNPHPAVVQSFTDPKTGRFDPAQVMIFLQRLDEDKTGETRTRWLNFEKFLKQDRLRTKFSSLVKKGMYIPDWEAKEDYQIKGSSVNINYIYLPYSQIPDDEVTVTDEELQAYIKAHEKRYKQEASRSIEYVSFDILPTAEDTAKALNKLKDLEENFKNTANDSIFIKLYSDHPFDPAYYGKGELQSSIADTFFVVDTNTIIGPYQEDSAFVLAKLLDRKLIPDSVKARHIFLSVNVNDQEDINFKRNLIDSLKLRVEAGEDFGELAMKYSDDEQTKFNGGDWGWIKPGEKFQTINNNLFYKKQEGDLFIAPSNNGFHLIQITKATPVKEAVKVAFLSRQIVPSTETERALYAKASEFAGTHSTAEKFKEAESEYSIKTAENIKKGSNEIFGLGSSRDLVKWVFNANENDISSVFSLDDKFVVARVSKVKEEGITPLADIKAEVEYEVKKEKKADLLAKKIKDTGSNSLSEIASQLNVEVRSDSSLTYSNNLLAGVGLETDVVNNALTMNENEVSEPITGNNGVFVVKVASKDTPSALSDASFRKMQMMLSRESKVDASLQEAIKNSAEITDERYKFY